MGKWLRPVNRQRKKHKVRITIIKFLITLLTFKEIFLSYNRKLSHKYTETYSKLSGNYFNLLLQPVSSIWPQITEFTNYTLLYRNQDKWAKPTLSFIDDFALFVYINLQRFYLYYVVCCHLKAN